MTVRTLTLLLALGAGVACADGAKEAQALFEAMEAKLAAAKTISTEFTSTMGPPGQQLEFSGQLLLAEGNKLKFEIKGAGPDGQPLNLAMTSNGATTRTTEEESGRSNSNDRPTPENLGKMMRGAISSFSVVGPVFLLGPASPDEKPFETTNFALGEKEQDGERVLQVVEFDTSAGGQDFHIKLWIDTVSGLPHKRVIDRGEQKAAIKEAVTAIELDAEIPADAFTLLRQEGETEKKPAHPPTSKPTK